ncbi:MAG TPA: CPBP family intramembrane glutamic endopeptidase [Candidatus Dormibacteraeota bacterium]|nr:CPBP family intramembrane glutamic endopeptidase [Candidatus Dormibacteraeota bacterium]
MIAAAAPRRAAALTVALLLTAIMRSLLLPIGELPAAVGFVIALGGLLVIERRMDSVRSRHPLPTLTLPRARKHVEKHLLINQLLAARGRETPFFLAAGAGVATGLVLLLPVMGAGASGRPLSGFWGWGAAIVVIATLEEVVIRGRLQPAWTAEAGPVAGLLVTAAVFALIHLPRYGLGAMPLDFAVGLALGGLRAVTGRVAPCAIAHVIADWGAWFWL